MMFGRIQPYKCLELLIQALRVCKYKENINLLIAGNASNQMYVRKLEGMIEQDDSIRLQAEFISLKSLKDIVKDIDAFVLPMDLKSSLNSSAVMMAFSLARTVICPRIGTVQEYNDIDQFAYCYEYSTAEEHIQALKAAIEKAYEDYISSDAGFSQKGEKAYETVQRNNSINCVAEQFRRMICTL